MPHYCQTLNDSFSIAHLAILRVSFHGTTRHFRARESSPAAIRSAHLQGRPFRVGVVQTKGVPDPRRNRERLSADRALPKPARLSRSLPLLSRFQRASGAVTFHVFQTFCLPLRGAKALTCWSGSLRRRLFRPREAEGF